MHMLMGAAGGMGVGGGGEALGGLTGPETMAGGSALTSQSTQGGGLLGSLTSKLPDLGRAGAALQATPLMGNQANVDPGRMSRATGAPLGSLDNLLRILESRRAQRMGQQRRSFLSE